MCFILFNFQFINDYSLCWICFLQSAWTWWFPGCSVWGNQATPHISAGWVSVKQCKKTRHSNVFIQLYSLNTALSEWNIHSIECCLASAWIECHLPLCPAATMCVSWRTGRQAVGRHTPWWDPSRWRSSQGHSRRPSRVLSPRLLLSSFGEMTSICFCDIYSVWWLHSARSVFVPCCEKPRSSNLPRFNSVLKSIRNKINQVW